MRDLYNKRSNFAHGSKDRNEVITEDDYFMAYSFVSLIMISLLNLIEKGYTHITKKDGADKKYLDLYIEKMKYN